MATFDAFALGAVTLTEIVEYLRGLGIATLKLPERLELRDELPRNPLGKVLKRDLREELRALRISLHAGVQPSHLARPVKAISPAGHAGGNGTQVGPFGPKMILILLVSRRSSDGAGVARPEWGCGRRNRWA